MPFVKRGPGSSVSISTGYGLDSPGIESRCGRDFPHCSGQFSGPHSLLYNGCRVFPGGRERPGHVADPSPRFSAVIKKELYLYFPYGPYVLYRASVPVKYSYTSTPPMGCTSCTEPQCLHSTAIPLLPIWTVRPIQSLSACKV